MIRKSQYVVDFDYFPTKTTMPASKLKVPHLTAVDITIEITEPVDENYFKSKHWHARCVYITTM